MKNFFLLTSVIFIAPSLNLNNYDYVANDTSSNINNYAQPINKMNEDEDKSACTFVYVGKQISEDGVPMICRSVDSAATTADSRLTIYKHNELANKNFTGKNGFTYTLPKETAKCVVAPMNEKFNIGPYMDDFGINEYGVALSATLTCATNNDALNADPFVSNGIAEETITHTIVPQAKTARGGAELLIHIIEDMGSAEPNAVFIADQKEVWYIEMYTGHRSVAVKLPEDKMFVLGNEFGLETLTDFTDDNVIKSKDLENIACRKPENPEEPINLFNTYARPLVGGGDPGRVANDNSHRRTWRGLNLYGGNEYKIYESTTKYPFMFTPNNNKKLNVNDVIAIYRDTFREIIEDELNPNHEAFLADLNAHVLRTINCDRSTQVHILCVDPDLNVDKSMAAYAWLAFSPARYAPFIPVSASITDASSLYLFNNPSLTYDDKSAYWAYRLLNTIANFGDDKEKYPNFNGDSLTKCLDSYQNIWEQEFKQIYDYAKQIKNKSKRNQLFTNYCTSVQKEGVKLARGLADDCMWYFANVNPMDPSGTDFYPLVDLKEYTHKFGYTYKKTTNGASVSKNGTTYTIIMPSGMRGEFGQIKCNDEVIEDKLYAQYKGNIPYIDFEIAMNLFESTIVPVNFNDYLPKNNILPWLLPTIIIPVVAIGGGLIFYFLYYKKRQTKVVINN